MLHSQNRRPNLSKTRHIRTIGLAGKWLGLWNEADHRECYKLSLLLQEAILLFTAYMLGLSCVAILLTMGYREVMQAS